jgi:transposase
MRGDDAQPASLFSYIQLEDRIPADHPLRVIRTLIDPMLAALSPRFDALYSPQGRRSIAPEKLLRALLLQVLYTIRSERQLMEQLNYNLLFRWFVGLGIDDPVWVPTVFTKNRDRLLAGEIADALLHEVLRAAQAKGLLSHEHFTIDGTLLEAWASHKSFRPKNEPPAPPSSGAGRNPSVDFRGERRSNATHASTTDPDARLARKSNQAAAILGYQGSVLLDNRHGLVVATHVTHPSYTASMGVVGLVGCTLAAMCGVTPRARTPATMSGRSYPLSAPSVRRRARGSSVVRSSSAASPSGRTTRHPGYTRSQQKRKLVEQGFGWGKVIGLLRKLRHRGLARVGWVFTFTNTVYNLVRLRTLIGLGVCS